MHKIAHFSLCPFHLKQNVIGLYWVVGISGVDESIGITLIYTIWDTRKYTIQMNMIKPVVC